VQEQSSDSDLRETGNGNSQAARSALVDRNRLSLV